MHLQVYGENGFAFLEHCPGESGVFAGGFLVRDHIPELRDALLGSGDPRLQGDKIFQDFVVIHRGSNSSCM